VFALASLAFFVQDAKGDLSLHWKGNMGFFFILLAPAVLFGSIHLDAIGAAYAWLGRNVLLLCGWVAIVHREFIHGINASWHRGPAARIAAFTPIAVSPIIQRKARHLAGRLVLN
jgi:hypothetical protein